MVKYIESEPIYVQSHEGNEFSSTNNGSNFIPALKKLRNEYGYPSENEKKVFLSISKRGEPLYVTQEYAPPCGGRPNDILKVYRILKQDSDYDLNFLCQLASDFFFGTHSACIVDKEKAFQTWVYFTEAVILNPVWYAYNFIFDFASNGSDEIALECRDINYERLKYAAIISKNIENTSRNTKEVFQYVSKFSPDVNMPFKINSDMMYFLYFCSKDSSSELHDYLCHFFQEVRKSQVFRHKLMKFMDNAPVYYHLFEDMENRFYIEEIRLLRGEYEKTFYINDAYYLGMTDNKEYRKYCGTTSIEYLTELLLTDFYADTEESDKKITAFFAKSKASISKKAKRLMKFKIKQDSDQKTRLAFAALRIALKESHQVKTRLKKLV